MKPYTIGLDENLERETSTKILDEMKPLVEEFMKGFQIVVKKHFDKSPFELSFATAGAVAMLIHSITPNAVELCIDVAHKILSFNSTQLDKEEYHSLSRSEGKKRESEFKPDYFG